MRACSRTAVLATFAVVMITGCTDTTTAPGDGTSPPLPPVWSMEADLSLFSSASEAPSRVEGSTAVGTHFLAAGFTTTVARLATVAVLALPAATFHAAAQSTPVFEDGAFHWKYSVTQGGSTFSADLAGTPDGEVADWAVRVWADGTEPPLVDFLWFTGRARIDGTAGIWTIFSTTDGSSGTMALDIDWALDGDDERTLTFTNVKPDSEQLGDILEFESDGDFRVMRYYDSSGDALTTIEWNAVSREGSIESPGYNDGVRACWDANLDNVACSG